jgi:hypothetical protein
LPEPYSPCTEKINAGTSFLVKEIIQQNITYTQKFCYDICFNKYLKEYAVNEGISNYEAYWRLSFDYKGNCSQLCPLECRSTLFEIFQTEVSSPVGHSLSMGFYFNDRKYTEILQIIKTTQADLIANTGGVLSLFLNFSFTSVYRVVVFVLDVALA